jgi:germination protein M
MKFIFKRNILMLLLLILTLILALAAGCDDIDESKNNKTGEVHDISLENTILDDADADGDAEIKANDTNEEACESSSKYEEIDTEIEKINIEVYYQDDKGYLIPVTREIPKQLSIAKASIKALIDTTINREEISYFGLYPILNRETEFTIDIKDDMAIIDFNSNVLDYQNEIGEYNFVTSVVYSLTQFDSIEKVKILINGYSHQLLKYGTDISKILSKENILLNSNINNQGVNLQKGMQKVDIFLLKTVKDNVLLFPLSIENPNLNEYNLCEVIVENLRKEYYIEDCFTEVPNDLRLVGSNIKEGLLTLNFNIEIGNFGGTQKEYGLIKQILYSMKQIQGVDKIMFLVNGEIKDMMEGTDISKPIPIPTDINSFLPIN